MSGVGGVIPLRTAQTDVRRLLEGALAPLREQAAHLEISLRIEAPSDLPEVLIDPDKIAWAVTALVGNALRFVRRGTRRMPGGTIVVRLGRIDDGLTIMVEDDGPGIPEEKAKRGLALMLIHDVVNAHGGRVEVRSHTEGAERGTRITLVLPVQSAT